MLGKSGAYVKLKDGKTTINGTVSEVAQMMSACVMSLQMKGVSNDDIEQIILNTEMAFTLADKNTKTEETKKCN